MRRLRLLTPARDRRGLTLGEMLIVLVVFSVLAIMFFMSSSHAIVKTRFSRVVNEQKTLASALQRYEVDYSDLPTQRQGLERLANSPMAYLPRVPVDPFTEAGKAPQHYGYVRNLAPEYRWVVVSVGPDGDADVLAATEQMRKGVQLSDASMPMLMTRAEANQFILQQSYDPTNGTVSNGDIISAYGE